jgi:hypothetical protein
MYEPYACISRLIMYVVEEIRATRTASTARMYPHFYHPPQHTMARKPKLTDKQRRMYRMEKMMNFRFIYRLVNQLSSIQFVVDN